MELFSKNNSRHYNGICQCCLKKGQDFENMVSSICNNTGDNYLDIIKDTFDVCISNNGKRKLICGNCVSLVQQANTFKIMLINSQKLFSQFLDDHSTEFVIVDEEPLDIKIEDCTEDQENASDSFHTCGTLTITNDFSDSDDDRLRCQENNYDILSMKRKALLKRLKELPFKPLPKKSILPIAAPLMIKKSGLNKTSKLCTKLISKDLNSHISEKNAYIINITNMLTHSNVVPFKGSTFNGFPCLFCRRAFKVPNLLREHFQSTHKGQEIRNVLWKYGAECLVIYVDVTHLLCNICNQTMPSVAVLRKHLVEEHKKIFYTQYSDRIIPFKLSENNIYECQVCGFNFETFGAIERHMNTHYRNYICSECGGGFVTKYRLKAHIKNMHTEGFHQCNDCSKVYSTTQKLKNHIDTVHKLSKRFKCPHCKERFTEYFKRQKHLVTEHGATATEYKCNVCDKVFYKRYNLSRHLKKDHLEERDYVCSVCPYKCFTRAELQLHMIRHDGKRIFDCKICKKTYARKKTLKEHMRIHLDDRRFSCSVCGQAFIQKCSLKCHMKTHSYQFNEQT